MIISTLIKGKVAAKFDDKVIHSVNLQAGSMKAVLAERMQIAVCNEKGEFYRAFGVTGLDDYMGLMQHLSDIDLVDDLKGRVGSRDGYDAIFRAGATDARSATKIDAP